MLTLTCVMQPRQYLAGSSGDQPDVNPNTQIIAVSVGAIALALVASGFVKGLTNDGGEHCTHILTACWLQHVLLQKCSVRRLHALE